ncbi:MAG TPA: phosphoribosylformylglycinamidine synthase subunit PurQ [Candidatus Omnitrophota bacterium]|nr:phosphoribosylformylglycinamidine synthase subunit PurQ [Candidatus Omnitrophota bacterium]
MKAAVVVFPGSNCDTDCFHALKDVMKVPVEFIWHKERSFPKTDLVVIPGGFSYGDYLRTGAIARFSPVMDSVTKHAHEGRAVIGICNGFQILLESGLLPGAMLRNKTLEFICKHTWIRAEENLTIFTGQMEPGETLCVPIAHGEGNYYCDDETLKSLQDHAQIVFRYSSQSGEVREEFNPNGSRDHIAGIVNKKKNVLGMMPHPERASEEILGSHGGRKIWESILNAIG